VDPVAVRVTAYIIVLVQFVAASFAGLAGGVSFVVLIAGRGLVLECVYRLGEPMLDRLP